nr:hypothetical protein [bacterium]
MGQEGGRESALLHVWQSGQWRYCDIGYAPPKPMLSNGRFIGVCARHAQVAYLSVFRYEAFSAHGRYEGVIKTTDAGRTWQWVMAVGEDYPDNLELGWLDISHGYGWPEPPIGVCVSPVNPDVVAYTTLGTSHRTDNGGKTWKCLYGALNSEGASMTRGLDVTTCYGYHTDPFNRNNRIISYTDIGCLRSEDGGNSWLSALEGVPREWINTCYWTIYDDQVPGRVYTCWASKHDLPLAKMFSHGDYFKANFGGVCVSEDGGRHWRPTLKGITCSDILLMPGGEAGARVLYAALCGDGVYKSTDSGETWQRASRGLPDRAYAYKLACQGDVLYLITLRAIEEGKSISAKLYASTDGGQSWQQRNIPQGATGLSDIAADFEKTGRLYVCCRPGPRPGTGIGGVHVSADGGYTWQRLPLREEFTHNISLDPAAPGRIYVTSFVNGLYRSDDGGENWQRLGGFNFRAAHRPVPDPDNPDMIYVPTFGSSVWHGPAMGNGRDFEDVLPRE